MKNISCFFTGHRFIPYNQYAEIEQKLFDAIIDLIENKGVKYFYCGGALGFDTMSALAVISLREKYDIKLILALPCKNQTAKWREDDILLYDRIFAQSDKVYFVSEAYTDGCMLKRNREMVDNCQYGIAYLTKNFGGTAYTVRYANEKGREIIIL